ncbi:Transposase and inactivated derivatives [Marinomonas polaris DSM 16579]|uniref:Transposase and inactivated derivatives n=1 Tax=Marinomonas polaris DSM 16579 TaxID=1122206 RepID=A0A1M5KSP1_9GAMM|nr:Transposase and inactivated derivatives [Marinomonas polaris DSM 16579]
MRKSKLSWHTQSKLIELFVAGTTARTAASLVGVNKTTASFYFQRLRQLIYNNSEHHELLKGEVEADEIYLDGRRKGKRGRGAAVKVPVFGLLKCNGKVYTVVIPDAQTETLIPIIREKVKPNSANSTPKCTTLQIMLRFVVHQTPPQVVYNQGIFLT